MSFIRIGRAAVAAIIIVTVAAPAIAQQDAYLAADRNGDGKLDQGEFKTFIDGMAAAGKPMAAKIKSAGRYGMAFARIDKSKDGMISPDELKALQ